MRLPIFEDGQRPSHGPIITLMPAGFGLRRSAGLKTRRYKDRRRGGSFLA